MSDDTITGGVIKAWRAAPNLSDPMVRPDWHDRAACGRNGVIGDDPRARTALMFSTDRALVAEALAVCEGCTVRDQCRDIRPSTAMRDRLGIWAGIAPPITRPVGRPTGSGTLNASTIRDIRERHQFGEPQWEIARDYGLAAATVSNIVNRVSYKWVS